MCQCNKGQAASPSLYSTCGAAEAFLQTTTRLLDAAWLLPP